MNDTPPEIEARYRALLMSRSGSDRVRMAAEMYDAAIAMIEASLDSADDLHARRRARFRRLYGEDFAAVDVERILHDL